LPLTMPPRPRPARAASTPPWPCPYLRHPDPSLPAHCDEISHISFSQHCN
jgi:hypothetical protein